MWPLIPGQVEPNSTLVYSEGYSGVAGKSEGGYLIDFNFPNFLVGRRSLELTGGATNKGYLCLATRVDFETGRQLSNYVNSHHEIPTGYYPFAEGTFSDVLTEVKRPEK
jgi:hypothetical protein